MLDVLNMAKERADARPDGILRQLQLKQRQYLVTTVHRSENTDDRGRLSAILQALNAIGETVVFPVHPRTRKVIENDGQYRLRPHVRLIEPLDYFDMVALSHSARLILTDSGGLQKEAYWLGVPCITLREETEWVETVAAGWNTLAGSDTEKILHTVRSLAAPQTRPPLYGEGNVAEKCVAVLE
jgi:UDP-GlcNAc3NAcA epimerase